MASALSSASIGCWSLNDLLRKHSYAARHDGLEVVGITLSEEKLKLARAQWGALPLRFVLCDHRGLAQLDCGRFDRILSVGMVEHVGPRHLPGFFCGVREPLSDQGLLLLHTIGYRCRRRHSDPWIEARLFPHGRPPAPAELTAGLESGLLIQEWHNFGSDHDRTLMAWHANIEAAWLQLYR